MFPKRSVWESIRHKAPSVYGSIEHKFYAFKTDELPQIPDMWKKDKPEIDIPIQKNIFIFL
jgi:hypothetical protein